MARVIRPGFSGSFYPSDPGELSSLVGRLIGETSPLPDAVGMVVPHAGMAYSGVTAGRAYSRAPEVVSRVILCAPSHRAYVRGAVVLDGEAFETPLGRVGIDAAASARLAGSGLGLADMAEHSIEVQLPFIFSRWPGALVIPVVTVSEDPLFLSELARILHDDIPDAFFIASSDLSHYHRLRHAVELDAMVRKAFLTLSPEALIQALSCGGEACGRAAMLTLLYFARLAGGDGALEIHYSTSADAGAGQSQVVGYFSGMVTRKGLCRAES